MSWREPTSEEYSHLALLDRPVVIVEPSSGSAQTWGQLMSLGLADIQNNELSELGERQWTVTRTALGDDKLDQWQTLRRRTS